MESLSREFRSEIFRTKTITGIFVLGRGILQAMVVLQIHCPEKNCPCIDWIRVFGMIITTRMILGKNCWQNSVVEPLSLKELSELSKKVVQIIFFLRRLVNISTDLAGVLVNPE